jgi:hypothetical protein
MTEMQKLIKGLNLFEIPFQVTLNMGTQQVWYPNKANAVCDVICHPYSYGGKQGLLEIMGLIDEEEVGDTVEGYLDAIEVLFRIADHYFNKAE